MNIQEEKKLKKNLLKTLSSRIKKNSTAIVGISGGPDSMLLLHFLAKYQEKSPFKIIVAHLNHGLRKTESSKDELFVKNYVENLNNKNIIFCSKKLNIENLSKKSKKNLEETGRIQRYKFFTNLAQKYQAKLIITAHHSDDNLETILFNLTRGASLSGLCGMQTIEKHKNDIFIFRPLLDLSKKQILDFLKNKNIPFRTDKSNLSTKYSRNFLRLKIIPQLKKLNPNLSETVSKNTSNLREINEFMIKEAQKWISKNSLNKNHTRFPAQNFRKLHSALQKQILLEIHKIHINSTKNIENIHLNEVVKILNNTTGNKTKKLNKIKFTLHNNTILISAS